MPNALKIHWVGCYPVARKMIEKRIINENTIVYKYCPPQGLNKCLSMSFPPDVIYYCCFMKTGDFPAIQMTISKKKLLLIVVVSPAIYTLFAHAVINCN